MADSEQAKHTPGPWRALIIPPNNLDHRGTTLVGTTYHDGMAIDCERSDQTFDECAANARLIAACPDLLSALQQCAAALRQCAHVPGVTEQAIWAADAAIAKALGDAA